MMNTGSKLTKVCDVKVERYDDRSTNTPETVMIYVAGNGSPMIINRGDAKFKRYLYALNILIGNDRPR